MADIGEITEKLEGESLNLGAANRKADTLNVFNGLILLAILEELKDANKTINRIWRELRDDD